ncbi:MAG: prolipoprotein diacylglyceryl transferase [Candidatus Edwardsbacteria bacterium]|jgi:phosphatidylglycerol:prolipoprotein diacylglycerol transferase|nr:prolipoprotein diacylglyceryl transferase [Candidatus Edwardsbacteria bacterium]
MLPDIVSIGPLTLHSYGLALALSFLAGTLLIERLAAARGLDRDAVLDCALVIMAAAVVGSRAFYVLSHLDDYRGCWWSVLAVWEGGLTFYGGVLLAVPAGFACMARRQLPIWTMSDLIAPAFALGIGLGRLGCFLNGCCYGKPSQLPWAVTFPAGSAAGSMGCALQPTQLYEAAFGFAAFALFLHLARRRTVPGLLICGFVALYSVWRFFLDFLRHYERSQVAALGLTNNQWVSVALLAAALVTAIVLGSKARRAAE